MSSKRLRHELINGSASRHPPAAARFAPTARLYDPNTKVHGPRIGLGMGDGFLECARSRPSAEASAYSEAPRTTTCRDPGERRSPISISSRDSRRWIPRNRLPRSENQPTAQVPRSPSQGSVVEQLGLVVNNNRSHDSPRRCSYIAAGTPPFGEINRDLIARVRANAPRRPLALRLKGTTPTTTSTL